MLPNCFTHPAANAVSVSVCVSNGELENSASIALETRNESSGCSTFTVYQPTLPLITAGILFIEMFPLQPELAFVVGLPCAVINAIEIELPRVAPRKVAFLMGMRSPTFQPKRLAVCCASDRALAVFHKVLPLLVRNYRIPDRPGADFRRRWRTGGKKFFSSW